MIEHFNSFRAVLHLKRSKKTSQSSFPGMGREWRTSDTEPAVRLPAPAIRCALCAGSENLRSITQYAKRWTAVLRS